jgi:F-type H+-transporting ATPase subunit delta
MRGTSEHSRDAVLATFGPVATAAGGEATLLAEQLFSVVDALDSSGSLCRALTDPARPGTDKATLVGSLFGALDARVQDVVADFAHRRWILASDLGDAIEDAAVEAYLAAADSRGHLDELEEELFRVERLLEAERDVLSALDDLTASPDAKARLVRDIFGRSCGSTTLALVERAARKPRDRRLPSAIAYYIAASAARRGKSVVHVTAAVDLTEVHRERLTSVLRSSIGREIQLNVSIDPSVIGGVRIQIGDQVVDGTILSKIDEARRRLVG